MMDEGNMSVEVSLTERAWIVHAIARLRGQLERSRAKEVPNSEVWELRRRELAMLEELSAKFVRRV